MSYTKEFDVDLFLSYGHIDNRAVEDKGWVDRFHRQLEARIEELLGAPVSTWRDNSLDGNHDYEKEIEKRLRQAAVLVPIVTPRFLSSGWCQRELFAFLQAAAATGGVDAGTSRRVFKVLKTQVTLEEQPAMLREMNGYPFYRIDENGRARELPDRDPDPGAEKRYLARIDDLAQDLHVLLKSIKDRKVAAPPSRFVYVAETTSDLQELRSQIIRELSSHGFGVLPARPLPFDLQDLETAVRADIENSCLFVNLVGSRYGQTPEGDPRCVSWIQQQAAIEHGKIPSIVWFGPAAAGTTVQDSRLTGLFDWLAETVRTRRNVELMRVPVESFKAHLSDRLQQPAGKPSPPPPAAFPSEKQIYLICDSRDFDSIEPVRAWLDERFEVVVPAREGTQAELREFHESALQSCDGVLIYYGAGSEAWLGTKIVDLRKSMGLGRSTPFAAQGILIANPRSEAKARYQNPRFDVMKCADAFSPGCLQAFVHRLAPAKGAAA